MANVRIWWSDAIDLAVLLRQAPTSTSSPVAFPVFPPIIKLAGTQTPVIDGLILARVGVVWRPH